MQKVKQVKKSRRVEEVNLTLIYILLITFFVLYIIFQSNAILSFLFGAGLIILIILAIIFEFAISFKESGFKKNAFEIIIALAIVIIFWIILRILLNNSVPIDVVPSCSMLPNLHRGDLIVVQGVDKSNIFAPIINISNNEFNTLMQNINNESLVCVSYIQNQNHATITQFYQANESIGLMKESTSTIVPSNYQDNNPIKYSCGIANVLLSNGTVKKEAYTNAITINNVTIKGDRNNSIVVYKTVPQDLFYKYGDTYIVHRAYAILNASGTYYVLTKGDNNPGLDIQYDNMPPSLNYVEGKVIFGIPYLGYLKLAMSSSFIEPAGCNETLQDE
jgi:signal peptidase I